jgi:hypothetical protein
VIQGYCGLGQGAAVHGGTGLNSDIGLTQDIAFKMGVSSEGCGTSDLPEDVLGLGTTGECEIHA